MELLQTGLLKPGLSGGDSRDRRRVEANQRGIIPKLPVFCNTDAPRALEIKCPSF